MPTNQKKDAFYVNQSEVSIYLVRIESQHLLQQVQRVRISVRIDSVEWNFGFVGERGQVVTSFVIED